MKYFLMICVLFVSAEKIYVGRDVTDRKEYGDVLLGLGNSDDIICLSSKHVTIKNSTRVPLGTTLYIGYIGE
jgi:hypothetical protein